MVCTGFEGRSLFTSFQSASEACTLREALTPNCPSLTQEASGSRVKRDRVPFVPTPNNVCGRLEEITLASCIGPQTRQPFGPNTV